MASSPEVVINEIPTTSNLPIPVTSKIKLQKGSKTPPNSPWIPTSPWGLKDNKEFSYKNTSFEDVMSEQLANQLQLAEDRKQSADDFSNPVEPDLDIDGGEAHENEDTSNDLLIAQLLQAKMDKEYNQYLTRQENTVNQNSKVRLSYTNYRMDEIFSSDDDDSDTEVEYDADTDAQDPSSNMLQVNSGKGYVMFGKEVVTKHDLEISGRKNTARLEDSFPVEFKTGDARGMDIQLSNKIYNSLKKHAYAEQRRGQRLHEEKEHYTAEHAVDEKTRLILHRLVDRGVIASVNGVVSIGKEAVVIHVDGGDVIGSDSSKNNDEMQNLLIPAECVVKIYKTTLNEFKARDKYIKDDYRFKDRFKKLNPRKIIHMWAEKEMHNLNRMNEAGIACPQVVLLRKHILVMSFIGHDQQPAPKLKSAILSTTQKKSAYEQVLSMMKTLYHECKLIHADLSEFNLLWHDGKVWMIDVSQSVEPSHPHGLEFLLRDCYNISKFFTNLGVKDVPGSYQLFNEVSGLDIPLSDDASFRSAIEVLQNSAEEHAHQGRRKASEILTQSATEKK
uniref:Serine/threonine-protein kinase RIO3 n=1 Tax=Phallusia mammillata TaxID=59560 RepID=A0A6F9DR48_9ASCI|nr:serine/threonine-protein kinase RIO1-like [Phallusia mammillata]